MPDPLLKPKKKDANLNTPTRRCLKCPPASRPCKFINAHHALSLAPTRNLPAIKSLFPVLSESQIRQRRSNTTMSVKKNCSVS